MTFPCLFLLAGTLLQTAPSAAPASHTELAVKARSVLDGGLADKDFSKRRESVLSLGLLPPGDPYTWTSLAAAVKDKDDRVRGAAVETLDSFDDKRAIPALKLALEDAIPEIAFAAASALYRLGDSSGRNVLQAVLSGDVRTKSTYLSGQKRAAMQALTSPRALMSGTFHRGLGFVPLPGLGEGVAMVEGMVKGEGSSGRTAVALLLAKDKDQDTETLLLLSLKDKDWPVRAAAASAIGIRGKPALRADLAPLLDDEKFPVRCRAAAAYLRLDSGAAPPRRAAKPK